MAEPTRAAPRSREIKLEFRTGTVREWCRLNQTIAKIAKYVMKNWCLSARFPLSVAEQ